MTEEQGVKNRINELLKALHISESKLSRMGRFSQKVLNNQFSHDAKLRVSTILFLLEQFPEVSLHWLLLGQGEMFQSQCREADAQQDGAIPASGMINAMLAAKDETIQALKDKMDSKEELIAALRGQLAAKDTLIETLQMQLTEYDKKEEGTNSTPYSVAENPANFKVQR